MELLYIDLITKNIQFKSEYYYFIVNYIIGKKISIHSNIGFYNFINKNKKRISLSDFIKYYESYSIYFYKDNKEELDVVFNYCDDFKYFNKDYKAYSKKKNLTKEQLVFMNCHNTNYNMIKEKLIDICKNNMTSVNLMAYSDLINDDIIETSFSLFKRNGKVDDIELSDIIFNNYLSKEKLIIAGSFYEKVIDSLNKYQEENEIEGEKSNKIFLPDLQLFKFPVSSEMSKEHLQLIRLQFNSNITILFDKIQNYRINELQHEINETLAEKLSVFYKTLNEDIEIIQKKIDDNIFFQKIINSDSIYKTVVVNLGIAPYVTLLCVYLSVKAITAEKFLELKNRCNYELGTFTGDFFLYYEIEPKINEKENEVE